MTGEAGSLVGDSTVTGYGRGIRKKSSNRSQAKTERGYVYRGLLYGLLIHELLHIPEKKILQIIFFFFFCS